MPDWLDSLLGLLSRVDKTQWSLLVLYVGSVFSLGIAAWRIGRLVMTRLRRVPIFLRNRRFQWSWYTHRPAFDIVQCSKIKESKREEGEQTFFSYEMEVTVTVRSRCGGRSVAFLGNLESRVSQTAASVSHKFTTKGVSPLILTGDNEVRTLQVTLERGNFRDKEFWLIAPLDLTADYKIEFGPIGVDTYLTANWDATKRIFPKRRKWTSRELIDNP